MNGTMNGDSPCGDSRPSLRCAEHERGQPWSSEALLAVIRGYQLLFSPWLGPVCRFHPSCSRYAATCIEQHGAARGLWLGLRRISRCHPWHPGGIDLPPAAS